MSHRGPRRSTAPIRTGGRFVKHARYYWLLLAEGHLTRRLFGAIVRRLETLSVRRGSSAFADANGAACAGGGSRGSDAVRCTFAGDYRKKLYGLVRRPRWSQAPRPWQRVLPIPRTRSMKRRCCVARREPLQCGNRELRECWLTDHFPGGAARRNAAHPPAVRETRPAHRGHRPRRGHRPARGALQICGRCLETRGNAASAVDRIRGGGLPCVMSVGPVAG